MKIYFKNIKTPIGDNYFWMLIHTSDAGKKYYLHTSGKVAVKYKNGKERLLSIYLVKDRFAMVKLGIKEHKLKNLVARAVHPSYKKGMSIVHKDRNPLNCDYKNLVVITPQKLGKVTGHLSNSHKVKAYVNGKWNYYRSIRECARALHCSYQTVLDYLNKRYNTSVIEDYKVQFA